MAPVKTSFLNSSAFLAIIRFEEARIIDYTSARLDKFLLFLGLIN